ncbi:hypothetical protein J3E72DRAFT_380174 [Bipolaris maydis]|nr:hypothetical protein J3E72DRAFT_380174 [Bipolaris maydis]
MSTLSMDYMPDMIDTANIKAIGRYNPRRKCRQKTITYCESDIESGFEIESDSDSSIEIDDNNDSGSEIDDNDEIESDNDSETGSECNISIVDRDEEENRANDDYSPGEDNTDTDSEYNDRDSDNVLCDSDLEIAESFKRIKIVPNHSETPESYLS